MSEAIEKTAAGATRTFFGALGFILLMVGVEGMTGQEPLTLFSAAICIVLGGLCFYFAFFWERAKTHLSLETQQAIGNFAQSRVTKFGMLFLVLLTLILSPFVEQHRWPFSYPADSAIYAENDKLKNDIGGLKVSLANAMPDAEKWRFSYNLRNGPKATNGERLTCKFWLVLSRGQFALNRWIYLQGMLDLAHWQDLGSSTPSEDFQGISILTGPGNADALNCATAFGKAFGSAYPTDHVKLGNDQVSPNLVACKNECVELDIGN